MRLWQMVKNLIGRLLRRRTRQARMERIPEPVIVPDTVSHRVSGKRKPRYYSAREWRKIKTRRRMARESRRRNRRKR